MTLGPQFAFRHFMIRVAFLYALVAATLMSVLGCSGGQKDVTASNAMRRIWVAFRDYEKDRNELPKPDANSWDRAGENTYGSVSWRIMLLDRMTGIPKGSVSSESIAGLVEDFYLVNGDIVYSNLKNLKSIQEAPRYQVIAITASIGNTTKLDWNMSEDFSIEQIARGRSTASVPSDGCYLLFACGNVGKVSYENSAAIVRLANPAWDEGNSREFVEALGVRLLEPTRDDYRVGNRAAHSHSQ